MKKVSLITIHLGSNFGSNLQTIATCEVIKKYYCDVIVVNYIPDRCTWKRFFIAHLKSVSLFFKMPFSFIILWINKYVYNSFLSRYVIVSDPLYSSDDFVSVCPKSDIYVTGSDQVWNSVHNEGLDRRYYFDGFPGDTIKIAYSSSIGRGKLDLDEYVEVKRMLGSYKAISVREESAKQIIESMGYTVTHLLDPTFMLNKDDWGKYRSKPLVKAPYVLVYLPYNIHNKQLIYKTVRNIAIEKGLKVVSFSWTIKPEKYADKTIYFANPGDFLSLMEYADYVVTNSFHGTAFSINLNKQFSVYLPTGFGTRIISILKQCSLMHRLLKEEEIISKEKINEKINYQSVNKILDEERTKAYAFLNKALNN